MGNTPPACASVVRCVHRLKSQSKAGRWLLVTPTKRRADCVQPHFCPAAAQTILKTLEWRLSMAKFVFGLNQSLDGYVDHLAFAPGPLLFRHFIEQVRDL